MGAYAGAGRRRVHLAAVLLRPPSGHRPGRRQARHVCILQIGLRLDIAQADARPVMPISLRQDFTRRNHEACGRTLGMVQPLGSREEQIRDPPDTRPVNTHFNSLLEYVFTSENLSKVFSGHYEIRFSMRM